MRCRSFSLALLILLAGCAQPIAFQRPAPPIPPTWPPAVQLSEAKADLPQDWRQSYPDPALQALIETALQHNRTLRLALARVAEARALLGVADADRRPLLALTTSAAAQRQEGDASRRFQATLNLPAFELDLWGRLANQDEAALQRYLASEESARAVQLTVVAEVAEAYLTRLELIERLRLTQQTLANRQASRALIARRHEVGLASRLELLQADGLIELANAELSRLERQRHSVEHALALLTGMSPVGFASEAVSLDAQLVTPPQPGITSEVLLARPDVRAAERQLMASQADVAAARAAFLPRITLTAALGLMSPQLAALFDAASGTWLFQPTLTHPLFDGGRRQALLELAEARRDSAVAEYERVIQQAFREVVDLLTTRQGLLAELERLGNQMDLQAERLRLAKARHEAGIVSFLEVLDAERGLYAAQQGLVQLRRALLVNSARLHQALGGGGRLN